MRKFIFIVLLLSLTMCDTGNISQDLFSPMFSNGTTISAEITAKDSGNLELAISNNSEEDFFISEGDMPLTNFEKDSFKINNGEDDLQYTGRLFYKNIQPTDWVRIESRNSKIITVHLPTSYDFSESGMYVVYFEASIPIKFNDNIINIFNVTSNVIDLVIDENAVSFQPIRAMKSCSSSSINLSLINRQV